MSESTKVPPRTTVVFGLLGLLVGLAYANALWNGFAFDDMAVIVENKLLTRLESIPSLLTSDYWVTREDPYGTVPFESGLYRPLVLPSYSLNYAVGGLNPLGYHMVNLVLHLFVTWFLYLLGLRLGLAPEGALSAAALFAVHPIHTEAVTGIVGRAELLMALGVLGGWWLALSGRYWWSLVAFAAGLFSKEQAAVLPALLILSDICGDKTGVARNPGEENWRTWLGYGVRRYGGYLLVLAAYLAVRAYILGGLTSPPVTFVENPLGFADWGPRILTALKVAGRYLWLCIWPASMSADYSYNAIPIAVSVLEPSILLSLLAWGSLLGLAGWSFVSGSRRATLCVGLTVITFLPASNLLFPIGTIMGERLFYLPSAGLCLLAGLGWARMVRWVPGGSPRRGWLLLAGICLALTARTAVRNHDWFSTETLFRSAVQVVPQSAKVHAMLGHEMKVKNERKHHEEALEHYQTALGIYPDYMKEDPEFASYLGDALFVLGRTAEAVAVLEKAVTLNPHWGQYLGLAYARLGQHDKAERAWRDTLAFAPKDPEIRSKLSRFLLERGRYEEGLVESEAVLKDYPDFVLALYNRALALEALGRLEEAAAGYERVRALSSAPEAARQDAERKLRELQARGSPGRPAARPCIPGLARC